jgi:catechol 2,3-dioxygenase-like lactoylglutathione lyase family enzyme
MTPDTTAPPAHPVLHAAEAQLYVADVTASCDFAIAFVSGEPPYYGQVYRDDARLNLRMVCEPVYAGDIREREHLLSATITLASSQQLEQLFVDFQSAGVRFAQALHDEPWGATTFVVTDPDGNLIMFAGPARA